MMIKGKTLVLVALLLLTTATLPKTALANVKPQYAPRPAPQLALSLIMDNGLVELKQPLLLEQGRILIAVPDLIRLLEIDCERQGEDGIILKRGSVKLTLQVGKGMAVVTEGAGLQVTKLDVPPVLAQNVLYLPLRFIAESFGMVVRWDPEYGCVLLSVAGTSMEGISVDYKVLSRKELQAKTELSAWYEAHHRTKGLYSLELDGDTYVLLGAGARPTGGYGVKIESVTVTNSNSLFIAAALIKPGPEDIVTMAITYPNVLLKFSGRQFTTMKSDLVE